MCTKKSTTKEDKMAKQYECICGDANYWFRFGKVYKERDVLSKLTRASITCRTDLFPGLVLQGQDGKEYVPDIKVGLKERT